MITRVIQRKRPRRPALLVVGAAAAVALLSATAVFALLNDSGTVDVQVPDKTTSQVDKQTNGGAFISYFGDGDTTFGSSGTGTFVPFVRLQGSPTEQGYNTDGRKNTQFDTKVGTWTHSILVSEIPQRPCPDVGPPPPGSLTCFELFVDINESNNAKHVSLNEVEVWYTTNPNLTGYVVGSGFPVASGATLEYDFSGDILIHDVNQGSGRGDLRYNIPIDGTNVALPENCNYGNPLCETYFVLYSQWGTTPDIGPIDYGSEGGFEEWKVRIYPTPPDVQVVKTPDIGSVDAGDNATFTIVVTNNGPIAAENVVLTDTLPNSGLSWTVGGADAAACSITTGVLTCNFGTIGFPTLNTRTITLTSATDATDCARSGGTGKIDNTATITASNEGPITSNNSDPGDITVVCADVTVVKTPDAETINAGTDAVFTVVVTNNGPTAADNVVLTDTLPDSGLSWTVGGADAAACSITTGVLTCNFGTIGYPTLNTRTITLTSATDATDCARSGGTGDIDNTALVSSTSESSAQTGNNSDSGQITVNCAAIQVLKQSTKTGNPLVTDPTPLDDTDNAVFTVTPPVGSAFDVTDNGTGDEDSTYGEVCVSGLAPGTYTVTEKTAPEGYGSGNPGFDTSAVAAAGTDCNGSHPSTANSAIFRNPPLGEIEVIFRDLGSGETFSSIVCTQGTTTIDAEEENGEADPAFDDTDEVFTDLEPGTYTCTVVVDP